MTGERRDVQALLAIQNEINEGRIRVYRNALNQAFVFCDHPDSRGLNFELFHRDFRGWMCRFVWNQKQLLLYEREIDRILDLLNGLSLENPSGNISDPSMLELLETNAFLALIVEFMEGKASLEFSMNELLKRLKSFAKDQGLKVRLPGGPNVLSRKLSELEPQLKLFGITVAIRRSNGAKVILTGRKDNTANPSSLESSTSNRLSEKEINPVDERKRRLEELKHRQQASPNTNSQNGGFTS